MSSAKSPDDRTGHYRCDSEGNRDLQMLATRRGLRIPKRPYGYSSTPRHRCVCQGCSRRRCIVDNHHPRVRAAPSGAADSTPLEILSRISSACAAVKLSTFAEWFIEQNFGPHIEQNAASLKPSSGSVSSCMLRAVSGSSESSNCLFQSKP